MLTGIRREVANMIFDKGAFQFGAFKLKLHEKNPTAPLSPFYINLRNKNHPSKPGPLDDKDYMLIARCLLRVVTENDLLFDAIAGIPMAGDPIVDAIEQLQQTSSMLQQGDFRIIRLAKEESEKGRRIIPMAGFEYRKGERIVLVDDLVTQADTKLEAVNSVESQEGVVVCIVVLIDREQGGKEQLEKSGKKLVVAVTIRELLDHYHATNRVDDEKYREALVYLSMS